MPNVTRRRGLIGHTLGPLALRVASAACSASAVPSINKFITSLNFSRYTQPRFILDFHSDEGQANVQKWYKHQGQNTRFSLLEYRKVKEGRIKHEFIVVWLNSTTLCRFDRRTRGDEFGCMLDGHSTPAEDSAHVLSSFETEYQELMKQTEVLLTIKLPGGEDLGVILAVCEGIQRHSKAVAYNLLQYNCYFFSWMIVSAVARRTYDWNTAVPSQKRWDDILRTSLSSSIQSAGDTKPLRFQRVGMSLWFNGAMARLRARPLKNVNSPIAIPCAKPVQDELLLRYLESRCVIEGAISKLLLRSQLCSALQRELYRVGGHILLTKRTVIERTILGKCDQIECSPPDTIVKAYDSGDMRPEPRSLASRL
ncbi:hypothetical protein FRC11_009203 [Ceratobasidium sp. 423]|nr:hypothetical protein FRC11_009203 [Ceratobasidium sp. 423]